MYAFRQATFVKKSLLNTVYIIDCVKGNMYTCDHVTISVDVTWKCVNGEKNVYRFGGKNLKHGAINMFVDRKQSFHEKYLRKKSHVHTCSYLCKGHCAFISGLSVKLYMTIYVATGAFEWKFAQSRM